MWTAYRKDYTCDDKDMLLAKHSSPASYDGTFQVFTCTCNPNNPVDTTGTDEEGVAEYTAQGVIDLIKVHEGAVLLSPGMATKIMKILSPASDELLN